MSIEDNKRLVTQFTDCFERSDVDAMLALMADDVRWWINGKPDLFPITGTITKAEFEDINRGMAASLNGGMKMAVIDMVGEGDLVAAELQAHAVTKEGRIYDNGYHMLFTLRDGRIVAVEEYTDLMTVADIFPLPPISAAPTSAEVSQGEPAPPVLTNLNDAKRVVVGYFEHFGRRNVDGVLRMMTEDATFWLNGNQKFFPGAGAKTKEQFAEILGQLLELLDGGLQMNVETIVAEGDRVVAQIRSSAITKQGKPYENGFLFRINLRDGKITEIREYTDLIYASAVFG
jgi:ketosteroid isomerase-like protein